MECAPRANAGFALDVSYRIELPAFSGTLEASVVPLSCTETVPVAIPCVFAPSAAPSICACITAYDPYGTLDRVVTGASVLFTAYNPTVVATVLSSAEIVTGIPFEVLAASDVS